MKFYQTMSAVSEDFLSICVQINKDRILIVIVITIHGQNLSYPQPPGIDHPPSLQSLLGRRVCASRRGGRLHNLYCAREKSNEMTNY